MNTAQTDSSFSKFMFASLYLVRLLFLLNHFVTMFQSFRIMENIETDGAIDGVRSKFSNIPREVAPKLTKYKIPSYYEFASKTKSNLFYDFLKESFKEYLKILSTSFLLLSTCRASTKRSKNISRQSD